MCAGESWDTRIWEIGSVAKQIVGDRPLYKYYIQLVVESCLTIYDLYPIYTPTTTNVK